MNRYDEIEIDLKDLIAELLTKWIYILLCCILVAAVMMAYAFVKDTKLANTVPIEERIANAKEALSVEEAETVERVFQQYESFTQYKESLQKYYNDYLFVGDDFSDYVAKDTIFCVSTNVYGAENAIMKLSLSPEVYEKINSILPEDEAVATINKRVTISSSAKNSITLLNDDEDGMFLPNDYVFTLSIVAKSQEQCDKIESIVVESINKQFSSIKDIDKEAGLIILGSNYVDNLADWLMNRQTEAINNLNNIENAIKNFNNNQISNLSDSQKKYYNVLLSALNEDGQNPSKTSKLKYIIVGFLGGGIIACGFILLKYLFDESVKTENDVFARYNMPVLKTIPMTGKKYLIVDTIVKVLRGSKVLNPETDLDITATDIGIMMGNNGSSSLYIVNSSSSKNAQEVAEVLKKLVEEKNNKIKVLIGTPERSSEAMLEMAKSDNVIILAETRNTKIFTVDNYYEMFDRFKSNVLGAVVLKKV